MGCLASILESYRQEDGKILSALNLPLTAEVNNRKFSSDFKSFKATIGRPYCKEETSFFPVTETNWALVSIKGSVSPFHCDTHGVGSTIEGMYPNFIVIHVVWADVLKV